MFVHLVCNSTWAFPNGISLSILAYDRRPSATIISRDNCRRYSEYLIRLRGLLLDDTSLLGFSARILVYFCLSND